MMALLSGIVFGFVAMLVSAAIVDEKDAKIETLQADKEALQQQIDVLTHALKKVG
jgi:hypothetical protein